MHRAIELYLNGASFDDSMPELLAFQDFLELEIKPRGWRPFRTEWSIFHEDASPTVSGSSVTVFFAFSKYVSESVLE